MPLDLIHIFSPSYLFNLQPGPILSFFLNVLLAFFGLMLVMALVMKKFVANNKNPRTKILLGKLRRLLLWLAIVGLLLLAARQLDINFLSAPFWLLLWLLGLFYWLGVIIYDFLTDAKDRAEEIKDFEQKKKYLPH